MTNEEAIKWLDEHALGRLGKGGFEAKIKIVKALNKQIPMKAKFDTKLRMGFCPNCEMSIMYPPEWNAKTMIDNLKETQRYCGGCGQRIDWSKE